MRAVVYATLVLFAVVTAALCRFAHQRDARIEEMTFRIEEDAKGEVVGVVFNGSVGHAVVHTLSCRVEILKNGVWTVPQPKGFVCGNVAFGEENVAKGTGHVFPIGGRLALVEGGQTMRVSVYAESGFNHGLLISNSIRRGTKKTG